MTGRGTGQAEIEASMRLRSAGFPLLVPAVLAAFALAAGCSKSSDKATNVQVAEPFESGDMSNSGLTSIFVHVFPSAGSFSYRCRFHPGMTGAVNVATGGVDSVIVSITNFAFSAASPIKPGGLVRWENHGTTHSVTRP